MSVDVFLLAVHIYTSLQMQAKSLSKHICEFKNVLRRNWTEVESDARKKGEWTCRRRGLNSCWSPKKKKKKNVKNITSLSCNAGLSLSHRCPSRLCCSLVVPSCFFYALFSLEIRVSDSGLDLHVVLLGTRIGHERLITRLSWLGISNLLLGGKKCPLRLEFLSGILGSQMNIAVQELTKQHFFTFKWGILYTQEFALDRSTYRHIILLNLEQWQCRSLFWGCCRDGSQQMDKQRRSKMKCEVCQRFVKFSAQ